MSRRSALLAALVLLAGCGVPGSLSKQAEDVESTAAEGALLAHDAAEGSTLEPFTRIHARALRKQVETLEPAIEDARLRRIAAAVATALDQLESSPTDRDAAARIERELEEAADAAGALAG